mmetsp:Transcript_15477/g.44340  ORF Transcript_15477/g.44340 Transcript_15477/m.44340 type:complete len:544 (-) Transcript_15477:1086-2717(-)
MLWPSVLGPSTASRVWTNGSIGRKSVPMPPVLCRWRPGAAAAGLAAPPCKLLRSSSVCRWSLWMWLSSLECSAVRPAEPLPCSDSMLLRRLFSCSRSSSSLDRSAETEVEPRSSSSSADSRLSRSSCSEASLTAAALTPCASLASFLCSCPCRCVASSSCRLRLASSRTAFSRAALTDRASSPSCRSEKEVSRSSRSNSSRTLVRLASLSESRLRMLLRSCSRESQRLCCCPTVSLASLTSARQCSSKRALLVSTIPSLDRLSSCARLSMARPDSRSFSKSFLACSTPFSPSASMSPRRRRMSSPSRRAPLSRCSSACCASSARRRPPAASSSARSRASEASRSRRLSSESCCCWSFRAAAEAACLAQWSASLAPAALRNSPMCSSILCTSSPAAAALAASRSPSDCSRSLSSAALCRASASSFSRPWRAAFAASCWDLCASASACSASHASSSDESCAFAARSSSSSSSSLSSSARCRLDATVAFVDCACEASRSWCSSEDWASARSAPFFSLNRLRCSSSCFCSRSFPPSAAASASSPSRR